MCKIRVHYIHLMDPEGPNQCFNAPGKKQKAHQKKKVHKTAKVQQIV